MTHLCKVCGVTKDATEYYASNKSKCKECVKSEVKKNRRGKAEYYKEYDRLRYQADPRVKERHKRYQATDAGRKSMQNARKKWMDQNPEKRAAHILLGNRIKDGTIKKSDTCQECGSGGRIHGHHEDYARPLDVEWLCAFCHAKRHNN